MVRSCKVNFNTVAKKKLNHCVYHIHMLHPYQITFMSSISSTLCILNHLFEFILSPSFRHIVNKESVFSFRKWTPQDPTLQPYPKWVLITVKRLVKYSSNAEFQLMLMVYKHMKISIYQMFDNTVAKKKAGKTKQHNHHR